MQKFTQGLVVFARRRRWRIEDVRPYGNCDLVVLRGAEASNIGEIRSVLTPFDAIEAVEPRSRPKRVRLARWRAACRALLAADTPPGGLRAAAAAPIDVFPHQLAPALAMVRGLGTRVLLADDVGLGKTMEAGLIVSELRARGAADRVLVLTPAGLRDQWRAEFTSRLGLDATVFDAAEVRRRVATLPHGVNAWSTTSMAIASLDYVKRVEVLPAVASCRWDVVIVDEAHGIAADTDRRRAVEMLADRAVYVVLLSATPHSGDAHAFASLCRTGAHGADDPVLVFRRTRHDVALPAARKARRLMVRPTPAEARMHVLLARFIDAVAVERGEYVRLVAGVLQKRACSSARSLLQSIDRRLAALDGGAEGTGSISASQLLLPLDDSGETTAEDDVPAWHPDVRLDDTQKERRMLEAIADAGRKAEAHETKIVAIDRLLRRVQEPAIVFTEYRDTLLHIASRLRRRSAILHGGLTRAERTMAVNAFLDGRVDLLLATDAAGEGLNLQRRCRIVVNVELPWNPMRLEQRIGRVDRIGQPRTVHAIHLVARGTVEVDVLARLRERVNRAQRDIAAPDPLESCSPASCSAAISAPQNAALRNDAGSRGIEKAALQVDFVDLHSESLREAGRLIVIRRRSPHVADHQLALLAGSAPWITRSRRSNTRTALAGRMLLLFQAPCVDGIGRIVESKIVGISFRSPRDGALPDLVASAARHPLTLAALDKALAEWRTEGLAIHGRFVACRLARERATALGLARSNNGDELQPGLFDRRAEAAWVETSRERKETDAALQVRLAALMAAKQVQPIDPRLLLVLVA